MIDIVINPSGGSGRTLKYFNQEIKPLLEGSNVPFTMHYSSLDHDIDTICRELTDNNEHHTIVIVGGDGSMNMAVNGICNFHLNKIGFIPCGSGNDLAKALGIERNPEKAVRQILDGRIIRQLDLGEIRTDRFLDEDGTVYRPEQKRRFSISCGIGFDAEICAMAAASSKQMLNKLHLGKLIYILTALKVIFTTRTYPVEISIDGVQKTYGRMLLAVVMNTAFEGGGFMFCPKADGTDQNLDYCIGNDLTKLDFFRIFPYAYSGKHVRFNGVTEGNLHTLKIHSDAALWVHTDGEVCGKVHDAEISLCAAKLNMIN